jgi:beta-glucosidase
MYLPGQNGGEATYSLLFGEISPSGKLAETWPYNYSDVPFGDDFGKTQNEIYKESVFVGYRYYTTVGKKTRYPFGYGLSYTSFAYENMTVEETESEFHISCDVTNTGERDGAEVVQLYVSLPESKIFRPAKELKGFSKIYLKAGETGRSKIVLHKDELKYWNTCEKR